jgi:quercetin dioxygenase-like cupin family protein
MKPTRFILGLGVTLGLVVGGIGSQVLEAQQPPVKRTPLAKAEVAGGEAKDAHMYLAEVAPGAQSGRHYHPGPESVYVLEGAGILEVEGKAPLDVKKGDHFSMAAKEPHNFKNASQSEPVKLVVFLVAEKGQPMTIMLDQPVAQQPGAGSSTSGAAATQPGSPTSSGAASSGAQPSASPK